MYALLLFIIFPILYNKNRTWYFIYTLLFFLIGRFVAYKIGLSYATIIHNVFYIGILLPFIFDKAFQKYFTPILLWLITYATYLLFLHFLHGNDFVRDLKDNHRVLFVFIFAIEVYESIRKNEIDLECFVKLFKVILLFEITLCWIQYFSHDFGNFFRIKEYVWNGEVKSMMGNSAQMEEGNLCIGTLMGASTVANFLTVSVFSLFLAKHKANIRLYDYMFLGGCVLTLLITGIRAPFLVLIFMIYFIMLRRQKIFMKFLCLVATLVLVFVLLPVLSSIGSQGGLESFDNTVMRSLNVFTQLETGSISEEGTLTWSLSMLPYIVQHPLLGNGLHYGSGYFMALNFHILEDQSLSDAGIFYFWAEYGLIGLVVFYFFYYYLVRICTRYGFEKSDIRSLVVLIFLLSIVDWSMIDNYCTTAFALAPIIIRYYTQFNKTTNTIDSNTINNLKVTTL